MQSGQGVNVVNIDGTVDGAFDSSGNWFPLGSCKLEEFDDSNGKLDYVLATSPIDGSVWKQQMTYNSTPGVAARVTGFWVKQS
jgi:hypothetical protein